ncbi:PAS domain S-box protein [Leptospira ognonensis]|uniref:PAS domain S-box protein n=1 Tax=Leptospira ognonensis TaxID=2484945 RepID=A0A4R9JXD7_9LEPT|nr:7TM diverse intracellular signaling domain-containing protein [Leptospira ognonensis]TGL56690.1 PAS domain S-box protein [Leptospira ognonensis]
MKTLLTYLITLFALLYGLPVFAEVAFPIKADTAGKNLLPYLYLLEDKTSSVTAEEILSGSLDSKFKRVLSENLGFSSSQFWVRLPVANKSDNAIHWFLEFNFPLIDEIEIYSSNLSPQLKRLTGDQFPFSERNENYRNVIFPLIESPNSEAVYYLRIKSESTIPLTLEAWSMTEGISKMNKEQIIFGLFYGIMLVMIFYNFSIYVFTRDKSYLLYVLFITSISLFHLANNGIAFQYLWPESVWWANYCLPFFIITSCFSGVFFAIHFLSLQKLSHALAKFMLQWGYILIAVSIITFFFSYRTSILLAIGFALISLIIMVSSGVVAFIRKGRTATFYLIAWTFFLLGVGLYSLKSLGLLPDNQITRWTIQIGTALEVTLLSLGLADRINSLSRSLRENLRELSHVNAKIEDSEKRFREIFQGADEVILLLNEDTEIINANRALAKHLGYRTDDIKGKKLADLLFPMKGKKAGFNLLYLNDKFAELKMIGKVGTFRVEFAQKYVKEPKDMYIKFQFIEFEKNREILATLTPQYDDTLLGFIDSERIEFTINNYLRNAELVSQQVTTHLGKHISPISQTEIRTSLREIIINAIEHGNLNIGFDEKSEALLEGNYLDFIQKRQEDPRYNRKVIKIEYVLNDDYVAYRITDEGNGFDHKKVLERPIEDLNDAHEQHGRGIYLTKSVFDRIEYNEVGNQVRLIKFFKKG